MRFYSWASKTASSLNYGSDASFAKPLSYSSVKLPALSQIDCLTARQEIVSRDQGHEDKIKQLKEKYRSESSQKPVVVIEYPRSKDPEKSSSFPSISQVPLGGRERGHVKPRESVKFPSISQVTCLGGKTSPKERYSTRKFKATDTDSEFVRLSKGGGHKNLLHYVEAKSSGVRCEVPHAPSALRSTIKMNLSSDMEPGWKPSTWKAFSDKKQRVRPGQN